jgi:hypothetical protein
MHKFLASSTTFFQLSPFCATFFQLRTFMLFTPSKTSSSQRVLGFPIGEVYFTLSFLRVKSVFHNTSFVLKWNTPYM